MPTRYQPTDPRRTNPPVEENPRGLRPQYDRRGPKQPDPRAPLPVNLPGRRGPFAPPPGRGDRPPGPPGRGDGGGRIATTQTVQQQPYDGPITNGGIEGLENTGYWNAITSSDGGARGGTPYSGPITNGGIEGLENTGYWNTITGGRPQAQPSFSQAYRSEVAPNSNAQMMRQAVPMSRAQGYQGAAQYQAQQQRPSFGQSYGQSRQQTAPQQSGWMANSADSGSLARVTGQGTMQAPPKQPGRFGSSFYGEDSPQKPLNKQQSFGPKQGGF